MLVFDFFYFIILKTDLGNEKLFYEIFGIISVILLLIGNFLYYFSAYFAYQHFETIFLEKLGAKELFHKIFRLYKFQYSMVKTDLGLIIFLLTTTFAFDHQHIEFVIIDCVDFVLSVFVVLLMYHYIRNEKKRTDYFYFMLEDIT